MRLGAEIIISEDTLLDLMQVSRLWNIRISSSATLWVDIILEDEYDATTKAYLALRYSKQAPLALYMDHPTGWWDTLQEHIVANRARITKLFIQSPHETSWSVPILRQLSPLPSLATFYHLWMAHGTQEGALGYLLDSPISRTDLWLDRGILEGRTTRGFRGIRLSCELEDVFDLLEGSEHLEDIIVDPGITARDDKPTLNIKDSFLQGPPLPWKSLKYRSDRDSFIGAIIARLPKLVELQIHVSHKIFFSLIPLIFQLENLSIFEVTMGGKWERFERLVIPQASTSVREAGIHIYSDIYPVMEAVVGALFLCLPNIRLLRLRGADFPTIRMLTSSSGFQYLQALSVSTLMLREDTWSNSDGVLEPFTRSVERVSYWINGPCLKPLIPLQSRHINYLEIRCLTSSEMDMCSQRWPAMRTIVLDHHTTVNWKGPIYLYLHTISLKYALRGGADRGRNGTKVCRDIALHPEYFPALSKLEFEPCPELDILFLLLETRNVATRPGISPIATLVIPTRYPPFMVERLRGLVKGATHGDSSYYHLSIAGNYDIIMDASMALRFCTQPVKPPGASFPALVMEYPERVTEILESWDLRAQKWYPVEKTLRFAQCMRQFPSVSIVR